jgi:hypothetical protein
MISFRPRILLVATAAVSCSVDSVTPSDGDPGSTAGIERRVDPSATGAGITNSTGQHFVFAPGRSNQSPSLLVFLPGTGGRPEFYTTFLRHAERQGHHAIGLAYANTEAVNDLCASAPSPTCQEDARVEVITGAPRSALVSVDVANSIDNRLAALVSWLDRNFPAEGWSAYLTNGGPRWDRVIVAGHSQGGGHAAMIARLRVVRRAILLSATEPAAWTTMSFATAKSGLYGFAHERESAFNGITASWRLMAMPGPITSVDAATPPFGGSHQLQTSTGMCRTVAVVDTFHNCVITDGVTPLGADSQPVFGPIWTYLLQG